MLSKEVTDMVSVLQVNASFCFCYNHLWWNMYNASHSSGHTYELNGLRFNNAATPQSYIVGGRFADFYDQIRIRKCMEAQFKWDELVSSQVYGWTCESCIPMEIAACHEISTTLLRKKDKVDVTGGNRTHCFFIKQHDFLSSCSYS